MNSHVDGRGRGCYDIFPNSDMNGQVNVSTTMPGIVRGFHWHKLQTDHVFVVSGTMHIVLVNPNEEFKFDKPNEYFEENGSLWREDVIYNKDDGFEENILVCVGQIEHHHIGEHSIGSLKIVPGVIHGFSPAYGQPATMIYYTTEKYNPDDELRLRADYFGHDIFKAKSE